MLSKQDIYEREQVLLSAYVEQKILPELLAAEEAAPFLDGLESV